MKILITGCAGFIGANFTNYWLDTHPQDTVIGVDALTYAANPSALDALVRRFGFVFYHANICDRDVMGTIFQKEAPDLVVNFAAETHVDRSIDSAGIFVQTNVLGTQVLLDMCLIHGKARFHQISTDEVYGDLPLDSLMRFDESSPLLPSSPYSASKAAADLLALSYHRTHGLPVTVSRCSNNYGIYQHEEKLIPKSVYYALNGQSIPLYGNGENRRNWIAVYDHCRAIDLVLARGRVGEIYNVASADEKSNIALVREILRLLDCPSDGYSFVEDRKGHDRSYPIDSTKIERELGFSPVVDLESGLRDTVQYYKSQYKK